MFDAIEPGERVCVDFFGAPAYVSSASARIALRTGARVLPAVLARDANDPRRITPFVDYDIKVVPTGDEEADVLSITQAMARSFEGFIRRFPDQWFAFHAVWQQPEPEKTNAEAEPEAPWWKVASLSWAVSLGSIVPRPVQYFLARLLGDFAYTVRKGSRADVEDNMRHVLGPNASKAQVRKYTREVFRNVARYFTDLVRLPSTSGEELLHKRIQLQGLEKLQKHLAEGRGVIVATAHYGNPEMAVQLCGMLNLDTLVLAEPLPPALARLMERVRSAFGTRYVDVGYGAISQSLRHLRAGGVLAIAADRDIQGKGIPLPFFGAPARFPLGAAELAARTNAVLLPGYCKRSGAGFQVVFEDAIEMVDTGAPKEDSLTNTRLLLQRFENWLRDDPGQWMVLDRIWKPIVEEEKPRPAMQARVTTTEAPATNGANNGTHPEPAAEDESAAVAELQ
jgi:KDO2-lipid IV(A) lauroyltransferase